MSKNKRGLMTHDWNNWHGHFEYDGYAAGGYRVKKGWDTGDAPKVCTNCDHTPKDKKQKIHVDYMVWKALLSICDKVKVEWQALLTGELREDGTIHITGYFIPKQEVSSTSVKNLEHVDDVVIAEKKIIAGVHSHGNMSCFFSPTDVEDTNMSLIKTHIVVNNDHKYVAQHRIDLPCGMVKFIEAEVFTVSEPVHDVVGIDNIKEKFVGFATKTDTPLIKSDNGKTGEILYMLRWCPICHTKPEEDAGTSCTCWTKGARHMLPDFTYENYELEYGRTYTLKTPLATKFKKIDSITP